MSNIDFSNISTTLFLVGLAIGGAFAVIKLGVHVAGWISNRADRRRAEEQKRIDDLHSRINDVIRNSATNDDLKSVVLMFDRHIEGLRADLMRIGTNFVSAIVSLNKAK